MTGLDDLDPARRHAVAVAGRGDADKTRRIERVTIEIVLLGGARHGGGTLAGGQADHPAARRSWQMLRQHDVRMRRCHRGVEDRTQERAAVGHRFIVPRLERVLSLHSYPGLRAAQEKAPCGRAAEDLSPCGRQPPTSALITSPNSSHFSPLNRISCSWLIGAKSVGEVSIVVPGSNISARKFFRFAACFITFSRVRSSPHCFSTCTSVCATLKPTTVPLSSLSPSGKSLFMKSRYCFMPGSLAHCGSVVSFRYWAEMMSCALLYPAGLITLPTEAETLLRMCSGFHSISATFLIACAANFGVAMSTNTSALLDLSLTICESMLGSEVSKLSSAMIIEVALAPRPSLNPFR